MSRSSERIRLAAVEKKKLQVDATKKRKEEEQKLKQKKAEERKKKQNELKVAAKAKPMKKTKREPKQYEVSGIVDVRYVDGYKQYLVAWVGYKRPSWTDAENLIQCDEALAEFRRRTLGKRKSSATVSAPRPNRQRRAATPRPDTSRAAPRPDTPPRAVPKKDPNEDDALLKECEKFFGSRCLYRALEVDRDAEDAAIRKAYRARCLLFHPDKNWEPGAGERYTTIKRAYDVLSDPWRKELYDEEGRIMKELPSLD